MGETLSPLKIRRQLIKVTLLGEIRANQVRKLYRKFAAIFQGLRRRVITQRIGATNFGKWTIAIELVVFEVMRKWKWLFVNGNECGNQIFAATEFLISAQLDKCCRPLEDYAAV